MSLAFIKSQKGDEKNGRGAAATPARSPSLLPRNPSRLPLGRLVLPPLFVFPLFREESMYHESSSDGTTKGRTRDVCKGRERGRGGVDGWAGYGYGVATGWLRGGYDLRHFVFLFYRMLAGITSW